MDKLECIVIVPSCTEQPTCSVDAMSSDDATGNNFLLTCQVTEVLLQSFMFPFNNAWKIHIVLLVSWIHQWNVEAGKTVNCSDVTTPSPIRSTVRCGSFYVMTSLRDIALAAYCLSASQVKVITKPALETVYYTLVSEQKRMMNKSTLFDVCGKCFHTWGSKEHCFETYRGEICM